MLFPLLKSWCLQKNSIIFLIYTVLKVLVLTKISWEQKVNFWLMQHSYVRGCIIFLAELTRNKSIIHDWLISHWDYKFFKMNGSALGVWTLTVRSADLLQKKYCDNVGNELYWFARFPSTLVQWKHIWSNKDLVESFSLQLAWCLLMKQTSKGIILNCTIRPFGMLRY